MTNRQAIAPPSVTQLPRTWEQARRDWGIADWLAIGAIPLIFGVGFVTVSLFGTGKVAVVADTTVRILLCIALLALYRHVLAEHWRRFTQKFWRNTGIVLLGAIAMQVVISLVRLPLPRTVSDASSDVPQIVDPATAQGWDLALLFFAMLGPLAIVIVEEAVFRHTLLVKLPVWGSKFLAVAAIVLNGVLFGAVHYFNFGSLLATVPFMVVGMAFNLIYLWQRNLWHVILMHLVNNAVLGLGGLLLLLALRNFIG